MSFDGKTGLHFERVYLAEEERLDGEVIGFGFFDYGSDEPVEQPEAVHVMTRPEALMLWSVMRVRLGIDAETEAMSPKEIHEAWMAYVERGEREAFDRVCEQLRVGLLVMETTETGYRIRKADQLLDEAGVVSAPVRHLESGF